MWIKIETYQHKRRRQRRIFKKTQTLIITIIIIDSEFIDTDLFPVYSL